MSDDRQTRHMKKERRYKGKSDYLGAFGVAGVFTFVGIVSVILVVTNLDFIGLRWWGYWLFIPAFFNWVGGIAEYVKQKRLKEEVLAVLESYQTGSVDVDNLAQEVMMEQPSLMRLLIDLRVERRLKFRVDSKTGAIIFGESYVPPPVAPGTPAVEEDKMFCPQCGQRIAADSTFCPNCGSSVQ